MSATPCIGLRQADSRRPRCLSSAMPRRTVQSPPQRPWLVARGVPSGDGRLHRTESAPARHPQDWRWSSFNEYAGMRPEERLQRRALAIERVRIPAGPTPPLTPPSSPPQGGGKRGRGVGVRGLFTTSHPPLKDKRRGPATHNGGWPALLACSETFAHAHSPGQVYDLDDPSYKGELHAFGSARP